MTKELHPAWLKSKNEFGQEVNLSPITKDQDVLVTGGTNLEEEIEAIYHAIDDISLTPGPQGPQGLRGEKGAKGIVVSETEPEDPEIELWIDPQFNINHIINLEDYYKKPEINEMVAELNHKVDPLQHQVDELIHPLQIQSFTCQPSVAEIGTTLLNLTLSWAYSRDIKAQRLDGHSIDASLRTQTLTGAFSDSRLFKLESDGYSKTVSATASFNVMNRVYWGMAGLQMSVEELIPQLQNELRNTRKKTFAVTAGVDQYIYYAYPSRYGHALFMVGGFEGGFEKMFTTALTNASQYTEEYVIYRSTNQNLGTTTVSVE